MAFTCKCDFRPAKQNKTKHVVCILDRMQNKQGCKQDLFSGIPSSNSCEREDIVSGITKIINFPLDHINTRRRNVQTDVLDSN